MSIEADFERIDGIRSITDMGDALKRLPMMHRRDVILHALRESRFQFTWSSFAKKFRVPKKDWPPQKLNHS